MKAPHCASCARPARLTRGTEIYPHRKDLAEKSFWKCDGCGGRVGCHPGTTNALGTPAGPALRTARSKVHALIDPLWKSQTEKKGKARSHVYQYLAHHMGISSAETHIGMFNLVQCREAWKVMNGKAYSEIRRWFDVERPGHDNVTKGKAA